MNSPTIELPSSRLILQKCHWFVFFTEVWPTQSNPDSQQETKVSIVNLSMFRSETPSIESAD